MAARHPDLSGLLLDTIPVDQGKEVQEMKLLTLAAFGLVVLSGCMNMPTPSSQITSSYTSGLKYDDYDCSRLVIELGSLARRENQLTIAQDQRYKTSQTQAFWWGFGQGDGIEASELANVRGEKEAVRTAMEAKKCQPEGSAK
jgi:hypothetical protein